MRIILTPVSVKKEHIDVNEHASYSSYLKFFREGHKAFLNACGLDFKKIKNDHKLLMFIRKLDIEFFRELFLDDKIEVETSMSLGKTSGTFQQKILKNGEVCSKAKMVLVFVGSSKKPKKIPTKLRKKIETFLYS